MKRANIGCGSIQPEDWDNYDFASQNGARRWDMRKELTGHFGHYDYAVCSFALQELDHHEIPGALANIKQILAPGGVLRILVADLTKAIRAWEGGDTHWFPQDHRTGPHEAKFTTYVTWFGTAKSVFTPGYLSWLLVKAKFHPIDRCEFGETVFGPPEIVELDSRMPEALIYEARN